MGWRTARSPSRKLFLRFGDCRLAIQCTDDIGQCVGVSEFSIECLFKVPKLGRIIGFSILSAAPAPRQKRGFVSEKADNIK